MDVSHSIPGIRPSVSLYTDIFVQTIGRAWFAIVIQQQRGIGMVEQNANRFPRKHIARLGHIFSLGRELRRHLARALVVFAFLACPAGALIGQAPRETALRVELLARRLRDQSIRDTLMRMSYQTGNAPDTALIARLHSSDVTNTRWLKSIIERYGWPGRSLVGDDGASAAFLLVQHSTDDQAFMSAALSLLERAVSAREAQPSDYALLYDRVSLARGSAQRFGTQAQLIDGKVVFDQIEDSLHVDERRARLGLPSLTVYKRVLDSLYTPHAKSP
jgi:hypothetical protein